MKQFGGSEFAAGARLMAPIAVSGILEGAAFGAIAAQIMGQVAPVVMSVTAFSGSAQYAAVSVLGADGTVAAALLAAAALNVRYLAMSASVATSIEGSRASKAAACLLLTDAAWAVTSDQPSRGRLMGAGATDFAAWTLGTLLGVLAGRALPDVTTLGLDAAFPALFAWLLAQQLGWAPAAAGAALAVVLTPLLAPGLPILVAGLAAAAYGAGRR